MRDMFAPPLPLEFKKSVCKRKPPEIQGIAAMLKGKDGASLFEKGPPPPPEKFETPRQRHARIAAAKKKVRTTDTRLRTRLFFFFWCVAFDSPLRENAFALQAVPLDGRAQVATAWAATLFGRKSKSWRGRENITVAHEDATNRPTNQPTPARSAPTHASPVTLSRAPSRVDLRTYHTCKTKKRRPTRKV